MFASLENPLWSDTKGFQGESAGGSCSTACPLGCSSTISIGRIPSKDETQYLQSSQRYAHTQLMIPQHKGLGSGVYL